MNNNSPSMNKSQEKINDLNIRIRKVRQCMNISQSKYAELTNTSQSNISKYERNELRPTLEFLSNLHEKLNVNINWVLTGKGGMLQNDSDTELDKEIILQAIKLLHKAID